MSAIDRHAQTNIPDPATQKRTAAEIRSVTIPRANGHEIFLTAQAADGETPESLFGRIAAGLRQQDARVISLEVFGLAAAAAESALHEHFGEPAFPVTWLEEGCTDPAPLAGVQLWAATGLEIQPIRVRGKVMGNLFEDGGVRILRLGGLVAADLAASVADQAGSVFETMNEILPRAGMSFANVVRTWFYNHRMLDWYGDFNKVRTAFFKRHEVFDGLVPASTGVGGRNRQGGALTAGLLAIQPLIPGAVECFAVASPLQCPALDYGSSFSRAVEIRQNTPALRRLLISGTASIAPEGHTVHLGDVDAQIALTMDVTGAILESRGMGWADVSRAIAYFKSDADAPAFARYTTQKNLPAFPVLLAKEDICRDDLLFEIELDAIK